MLGIGLPSLKIRKLITFQQELDRPARAGSALNEPALLKRDDHVVDGRGRHPEVALHVGFSGRDAVDFSVVVDESQVLTLCRGIAGFHWGIVDGRSLLVNRSSRMVFPPLPHPQVASSAWRWCGPRRAHPAIGSTIGSTPVSTLHQSDGYGEDELNQAGALRVFRDAADCHNYLDDLGVLP